MVQVGMEGPARIANGLSAFRMAVTKEAIMPEPIDDAAQYRAPELVRDRRSPYRSLKTTRTWMRRHGGRNLGKRVVVIDGASLRAALTAI